MRVFNVFIPNRTPLTNYKIWDYARKINIPYFRVVRMLDNLPKEIRCHECGIANLNRQGEKGSYWVSY